MSQAQWHHLQQISSPSPSQIVSPNIQPVCERESILLQIIRSNKYVFKKLNLHRNMAKFFDVIYTCKLLYIWLHLWPKALLHKGQKHFNLNLHEIFDWKNIWFINFLSKITLFKTSYWFLKVITFLCFKLEQMIKLHSYKF